MNYAENMVKWKVGDLIYCHTPKTGKKMVARAEEACYTRRYAEFK